MGQQENNTRHVYGTMASQGTHEWHVSKTLNDMNIKLKSMTNLNTLTQAELGPKLFKY